MRTLPVNRVQNLYCLQAHLETLWEAVAIKAARLLNNLEYLAGMQIASKVKQTVRDTPISDGGLRVLRLVIVQNLCRAFHVLVSDVVGRVLLFARDCLPSL